MCVVPSAAGIAAATGLWRDVRAGAEVEIANNSICHRLSQSLCLRQLCAKTIDKRLCK